MIRISRRQFLARTAAAVASAGITGARAQGSSDIIVSSARAGGKIAQSLRDAIAPLGGIGRFIGGGERVMLLPNPQGFRTGASTRADLVGAAIRMCLDAGASEVRICSIHDASRWRGTGIDEAAEKAGATFWAPSGDDGWREVDVPGAARQQRLRLVAPALEPGVLINMPIAKHHGSTNFTGAMKNLMGLNSGNSGWHQGASFLVDSIVDLNSVVKPQLQIVDVTEVLAENGPFGPGRNVTPGRIVAGTDPVAVDTVCSGLIGMRPDSISTITRGAGRGLGTMNLAGMEQGEQLATWRAS